MQNILKKYIVPAILLISGSAGLNSCTNKDGINGYAPPLTLGGYTSSKEISPANLVAHWAFDNSLVDSVTGVAGVDNGTTFNTGIKKGCLQGAMNKYVLVNPNNTIQTLQSFTVSTWVNSPQNTNGIVGLLDLANTGAFWGNLTIFFENGATATTGVLKVHVNNNGVDAWLGNYTINNPWNTWIQVAVTYDAASSTFKVFVNGSRIAQQVVAGYGPLVFQNASKMVFGTVQFQTVPSLNGGTMQSWASYLTGQLDEIRIYNKALSESDVNFLNKLEGRGK